MHFTTRFPIICHSQLAFNFSSAFLSFTIFQTYDHQRQPDSFRAQQFFRPSASRNRSRDVVFLRHCRREPKRAFDVCAPSSRQFTSGLWPRGIHRSRPTDHDIRPLYNRRQSQSEIVKSADSEIVRAPGRKWLIVVALDALLPVVN